MDKPKVVFIDHIFPDLRTERAILEPLGIELIEGHCKSVEEVISLTQTAVAMMATSFKPINEDIFRVCPKLKFIIRMGIGVDTIDLPAATRYGICVCNVPDFCLQEVSDHTVALLLSLARKITLADSRMKKGEFSYLYLRPIARLQGRTVGFLGFGRIARLVANKISPFGVRMLFYDPYVSEETREGCSKTSLEETLHESDFLCVHVPETGETHHLLNRETLALMKPSAYVINTARGGIIDTSALIQMLQSGRLAGAALDVVENETGLLPDHPLCLMENVILTPHVGWYSEDSIQQVRVDAATEVVRFLKGQTLRALVNPEVLKTLHG
jgi:D-3-phosphoglycerate dehydrogenase